MKFEVPVLVRNIENPKDYEIEEIKLGLKEFMAYDSDGILSYCISFVTIWFTICLMFATVLGFIYLLKTHF